MKARDIMTAPALSVGPRATIAEVAALLMERRISGLPVVEQGRVVGIVSEGDLLRRHEIGTDRKRAIAPWWRQIFRSQPGPVEYVKSHAERVEDVMTREVVCISEQTDLGRVAGLLGHGGIKRLPVVRGGQLVGIVTRADLVQALASTKGMRKEDKPDGDRAIRDRLVAELSAQAWWRAESSVVVKDGIVHYWGVCKNEDEQRAARVAAENVSGVRRVDDHRIRYVDLPMMG